MTTAPAATLTVTLAPTVDPEALASAIKSQVADALRALAEELSPVTLPQTTERFYLARDSEGDFWVLDRERPSEGEAYTRRDFAVERLAELRAGGRSLTPDPFESQADYAPLTEVTP